TRGGASLVLDRLLAAAMAGGQALHPVFDLAPVVRDVLGPRLAPLEVMPAVEGVAITLGWQSRRIAVARSLQQGEQRLFDLQVIRDRDQRLVRLDPIFRPPVDGEAVCPRRNRFAGRAQRSGG